MKTLFLILTTAVLTAFLVACQQPESDTAPAPQKQTELLIYSGITMVRPLQKLADEFSAQHGVQIKIIQGASGFILDTLKKQQNGDIYFPGSANFRKKTANKDLFVDYAFVGYNRLALIVPKGNPKQLSADVTQLTNPELSVVISSPEASSVGRATNELLKKMNIENLVFENITYFTTDSHLIFNAIRSGDADLAVNWYATSKWPESTPFMDALIIDENLSPKRHLELNRLRYSTNPELALEFMRYASSAHGLQTFADFGFLTQDELAYFLEHPPQILPASK
ncbi:ABC transporter substrate-binding protein [Thiosulfatimonas sediminis]|uniref:ABC transporter substrate-binding protein n=1 Tax=Thiosulfatimonas sediminis TaxID=2675054 RepID=A0A6F8PTM1_9GAMM|nr:substrate-binding domain-containing protein [Thiosulfatimonas sediminis]BBP45330.1 ABC transporter substrate-binding protein [Thiosulfatimonas sediminis]